jgi:pimeloyl-ACP methyl ester carboxylesterase
MPLIDLSDVRCYFEQIGSGDPLLLIPGLGRTCRMWDSIVPELAESFTLIMPDNRGMGRSETKRPPGTLADLAVDLVELLDALQLERTHVLGISLGGMIAQYLAVEHPSRIDKLVLVSTAHHFAPYLRAMGQLIGHALRYFPRDVFDGTVEVLGSSPRFIDTNPNWIPDKIDTQRTTRLSRGTMARQLLCLANSEVAHIEYRIKSPTLIMVGEQDALIPGCYGRQIARDIVGSEFVQIPDCGHNPFIEMPEIAVPKIVEFLKRRDTSLKSPTTTMAAARQNAVGVVEQQRV